MDRNKQIIAGLSKFVNRLIDEKLSYYTVDTVDPRITYYIDNDGNGNPDWMDAIEETHNNIWEDYAGDN